jgi:hypothetical protein
MKLTRILAGLFVLLTALSAIGRAQFPPANPRQYIHEHTPYSDFRTLTVDLDFAQEIACAGIRTEWAPTELMNSDNSGLSRWGSEDVIRKACAEIKRRKLKLHVTLGGPKSTATREQNLNFYRQVMIIAAEYFTPAELTFDVLNEPWQGARYEPWVTERLADILALFRSSGLEARGYQLLGPTIRGQHGSDLMGVEIHRNLRFIETVYSRPEDRVNLKQMGVAFHVYVKPRGYDAGLFAGEKARAIIDILPEFVNVLRMRACTEYNVEPDASISEYLHGLYLGKMTKELERIPVSQLRFYTIYTIRNHPSYSFFDAQGNRIESRITGFKRAIGLIR